MANVIYLGFVLLSHHIFLALARVYPSEIYPTVVVDTGVLAGVETAVPLAECSVDRYLGIPYASPPRRWALPEAPEAWEGVRDASRLGDSCRQEATANSSISDLFFNNPPAPVPDSDDCLYLNVWTPSSACLSSQSDSSFGKPVLFWIYGGSFKIGTGGLPLYDGTSFAANQDIIVVTFNYRLNLFGFPGSPDIPKSEMNFGLHDQRFALDWVRRNIAAFGGDPNRITIAGESAGAISVDLLLTAPPNPVPFYGAIMESRPIDTWSEVDRSKGWRILVSKTHCASKTSSPIPNELECMRQIDSQELLAIAVANEIPFTPSPDDGITYRQDSNRTQMNVSETTIAAANVPILLGNNANEPSILLLGNITLQGYLTKAIGPTAASKFLTAFRPYYSGYATDKARDEALANDFLFNCPNSMLASNAMSAGIPTWRYFYNASFADTEFVAGSGAYHSAEVRYVFGTYSRQRASPFAEDMSWYMQKAWADFVKNPSIGPGWPEAPSVQLIGDGATPGQSDDDRDIDETVPASQLDSVCPVYAAIYDHRTLLGSLARTIGHIATVQKSDDD